MTTSLLGMLVAGLAMAGAAIVPVGSVSGANAVATQNEGQKRTPQLPDGRPDLNGTWDNGAGVQPVIPIQKSPTVLCVLCESEATEKARKDRTVPLPKYKPEHQAKVADLDKRQVETDPALRCENPGLPRIGMPDKIVQIPGQVVFLYDDLSGAFWRIIPTDGRPHRDDAEASALGDAVGRWEGDTLVIETKGFVDTTWLADDGTFHTSDLKMTEWLRREGDVLHYNVMAEDPQVLAEPWHKPPRVAKLTDRELLEPPPCVEQSLDHVVDNTHHDNLR